MAPSDPQFPLGIPGLPADRRDQIVRRIARDSHVRRRTAARWFDELLKFLDVCAHAASPLSPPPRVDKAWHVFILFTRDYRSYCHARHGTFIHHDPMEAKDAEAYERAYLFAEARYGKLSRHVWPQPLSQASGRRFGGGLGGGGIGGLCGGGGGCGGGGCGGGGC
jgi:uncharacterized membrane protein YgcG